VFLEDFLKQNGYHDVADAVADAVAAATTAEAPAISAPTVRELPSEQQTENLTPTT